MKHMMLGAAALALTATFATADVVRMGTEGAYPPFNFINDNGDVDGFERELGDALCERAALTCEWVTNDWDSIIPNLVSGNYDTIIAGMSITAEREESIDFTSAYYPADPSSFAAMSDVDLSSAVIAAQTGTIQAAHVAAMGAVLLEFPTPDETIAAVKNGEADAVFADRFFLEPFVEEDADLMFIGDNVILGKGIGLGIRKSDSALKETFNAAIASMKADGSLATILSKWFPDVPTDF